MRLHAESAAMTRREINDPFSRLPDDPDHLRRRQALLATVTAGFSAAGTVAAVAGKKGGSQPVATTSITKATSPPLFVRRPNGVPCAAYQLQPPLGAHIQYHPVVTQSVLATTTTAPVDHVRFQLQSCSSPLTPQYMDVTIHYQPHWNSLSLPDAAAQVLLAQPGATTLLTEPITVFQPSPRGGRRRPRSFRQLHYITVETPLLAISQPRHQRHWFHLCRMTAVGDYVYHITASWRRNEAHDGRTDHDNKNNNNMMIHDDVDDMHSLPPALWETLDSFHILSDP